MNDRMDQVAAHIWQEIKERVRKKVRKIIFILFLSMVPFLLILFCGLFIGSGVFSAFSVFGSMLSAIFGDTSQQTVISASDSISDLALEELITVVRDNKIDVSFYNLLMMGKEEFLYLLESVQEYNTDYASKTIQVEQKHVYQKWVEDTDSEEGRYITVTDYAYLPVEVDSREIEDFQLDWQLVYVLCISNMMRDNESWMGDSSGNSIGQEGYFSISKSRIDDVIESTRMKYDYLYDLARSTKESYTLDECQAMVHTPYQYGDPDTETGEWTYYIPHSVLSSACSGYSSMYYVVNGQKITHLMMTANMDLFDQMAQKFCYNYSFGYVMVLLSFLPGGSGIRDSLNLYQENRESDYIIRDSPFSDYVIGNGVAITDLPDRIRNPGSEMGDLVYGDVEYDDTTGGEIVRAARRKIGCAYSQENRWEDGIYDCSSFVWRILGEAGIDLGSFCGGSSAAAICRGMVDAGMMIDPLQIQPGDIIFYSYEVNGRYRNVSHTAIYSGNGMIIHARGKKYGVCENNYSTKSLVCICRPYEM